MALRTTRWHPDTCPCVLEYQWDDAQKESERTHTCTRVVKSCPEHQGLERDVLQFFTSVSQENKNKNDVVNLALSSGAVNPVWEFGPLRRIEVSCPNLTALQKANLQTQCEARVGVGKVRIK